MKFSFFTSIILTFLLILVFVFQALFGHISGGSADDSEKTSEVITENTSTADNDNTSSESNENGDGYPTGEPIELPFIPFE